MKQLVIDEGNAKKLYPKASDDFKAVLEDTFGKPFFSEKPTDRIKTFADACEILDIDTDDVWHESDEQDEVAYKQLKVVVRALNFLANGKKEWVPDYNNSNERKWYPWFYMDKPGFRLDGVGCDAAGSGVGSRLVFITEELARYAANQFLGLYSNLFEI